MLHFSWSFRIYSNYAHFPSKTSFDHTGGPLCIELLDSLSSSFSHNLMGVLKVLYPTFKKRFQIFQHPHSFFSAGTFVQFWGYEKSLKSIHLHGSSSEKNMVFYKILLQYHTYKIKKTVFKNLLNWLSYRAFTVRVQIQHKVKGAQLSSAVSRHRTQKNNKWWLRDIFQVWIKIFVFTGIHSILAP